MLIQTVGRLGCEYQNTDLPDRPAGAGVPGGQDTVQHGIQMEQQPVGRVEDAGPEESGADRKADRRGPVAVQPGGGTDK